MYTSFQNLQEIDMYNGKTEAICLEGKQIQETIHLVTTGTIVLLDLLNQTWQTITTNCFLHNIF